MTAREEEHAALKAARTLERARKARAVSKAQQDRQRLVEAVRETRRTFKHCRCDFTGRSPGDLAELGGGCTMPMFACPRLDAVRRRVGK